MNYINLQQYYNTVKTLTEAASGNYSGKRWEDYETIKCPNGEVIDMTKLVSEQAKARAALIHLEPIFAAFVNKLTTVYTFQIATQATDGVHYFVNPQFTNGLTFEEKVFLLAHECMHCVLNHMRRGANHDHMRSNIAADYEVNQTLVELGLFKSSTIKKLRGLIDEKYANWAYESIYNDNPSGSSQPNTPQQDKSKQSKDKNPQQGNSSSDGSNNSPKSDDYKNGWNQAIADYKAGKLKIS